MHHYFVQLEHVHKQADLVGDKSNFTLQHLNQGFISGFVKKKAARRDWDYLDFV
jgi:hypothetical protein